MPIHVELARKAFTDTFATDQQGAIREALDVLALAEANISFGIRERTVARGLDPAELALVAAGGAGPLLACGIADHLQLAEVIVPPRPGLLAAWGLLVAPDRRESAITILKPLKKVSPDESMAYYERAVQGLSAPAPKDAHILHTAAMRYLGQGFEVEILVDDPKDVAELEKNFHAAHKHEYGFSMPNAPVEWVELRVAWEIPAPEWSFPEMSATPASKPHQAPIWEYQYSRGHMDARRPGKVIATVYQRQHLSLGIRLVGPVIVTEKDATTYIPTGWIGTTSKSGYLRVRKNE
jgi:N-methylhydantoinase A